MHIDLAVIASQWSELAVHDNDDFGCISIFGTRESFLHNTANFTRSLKCMATYIRQTNLSEGDPNSLPQLDMFRDAAWDFIMAIYKSHWDQLHVLEGISFRNKVLAQFNKGTKSTKVTHPPHAPKPSEGTVYAKVSKLPPLISPRLTLEALKKVREDRKKEKLLGKTKNANKSFAQATSVMNQLNPIEELYDMYLEEDDTLKIVEIEDDGLDFVLDIEGYNISSVPGLE